MNWPENNLFAFEPRHWPAPFDSKVTKRGISWQVFRTLREPVEISLEIFNLTHTELTATMTNLK